MAAESGDSMEVNDLAEKMEKAKINDICEEDPSLLYILQSSVQKRISALILLHHRTTDIRVELEREILELEKKYLEKMGDLFKKRAEIVNGDHEVANVDLGLSESQEFENELLDEEEDNKVDVKGIPKFWLDVLKSCIEFRDFIEDHDEPILMHLQDIRIIHKPDLEMSFSLEFHFSPNEYFTNEVLTKTYFLKCEPDGHYEFHGPEVYDCAGTEIFWKPGKDVTKKTANQLFANSFFAFFNPPKIEDHEGYADEVEEYLELDFQMGNVIKDEIVPRAIKFFLRKFTDNSSYNSDSTEDSSDTSNAKPNTHIYFESDDDDNESKERVDCCHNHQAAGEGQQ